MIFLFRKNLKEKNAKFACSNLFTGIFILCWHVSLIFLPILFFHFFQFQNFIFTFLFSIFFILFNGTRMRALGNIVHECCHSHFVPGRKANARIGYILCTLEFSCFETYRKEHFSHHRYLGNILHDDDFKVRNKIGICDKKVFQLSRFLKIVLLPKNWFYLLKSSFKINFQNKFSNIIKIFYFILIILLYSLFGFKFLFLFIVLPFITSYQIMKLCSDFLDHGGLYFNEDMKQKSRNHYFSFKPLNWIFFPRNDCFHLIHHLYPNIPTTNLIKKHNELLKKNAEYRQRRHRIF